MANYNLTNFTEANNLLDISVAINTLSGDTFFIITTVLIYVITFISMKNFDTGTAFMSSSFIVTFLAGILWAAGLVSEAVLLTYFVLLLLSVFLKNIID